MKNLFPLNRTGNEIGSLNENMSLSIRCKEINILLRNSEILIECILRYHNLYESVCAVAYLGNVNLVLIKHLAHFEKRF